LGLGVSAAPRLPNNGGGEGEDRGERGGEREDGREGEHQLLCGLPVEPLKKLDEAGEVNLALAEPLRPREQLRGEREFLLELDVHHRADDVEELRRAEPLHRIAS
jgi:hypothetical protein